MPQVPADKTFFDFRAGLNTEVSPLNFPDGVSLDEENFVMQRDGSRKRRRGLKLEASQSTYTLPATMAVGDKINSTVWRHADGNPDKNFIVLFISGKLHFWTDGATLGGNKHTGIINLQDFLSDDTTADVDEQYVQFTHSNKYLIVTGRYIDPVVVTYDTTGDDFSAESIDFLFRDFVGIVDGVPVTTKPAALSANHKYNLRNRGWRGANITTFDSDTGDFPSKNMVWYEGYLRTVAGTTQEGFGDYTWDSDKLAKEQYGESDAPQGALFLNPWDTTHPTDTTGGNIPITDWTQVSTSGVAPNLVWLLRITATHSLSGGEYITISGQNANAHFIDPEAVIAWDADWNYNGVWLVDAVVGTTTFDISVPKPESWDSWNSEDLALGEVNVSDALVNSDGAAIVERFTTCKWFAGRVFYAGVNDKEFMDKIFFSRIVRSKEDLGWCFQKADPTHKDFNALVSDDGGVIHIPGLGGVQAMAERRGALFVFADNGVWMVAGVGSRGAFTADGISVRKMSGQNCNAPLGVVETPNGIFYSTNMGIFAIVEDDFGNTVIQPITRDTVNSTLTDLAIAEQQKIRLRYDDAMDRLHILYSGSSAPNANEFNTDMVFDTRNGGFYKLVYPTASTAYLLDCVAVTDTANATSEGRMKYFAHAATRTTLDVCDHNHTLGTATNVDYQDFDGNEQTAFLETGYDNLADFQRYRQAPVVHVFCTKTETGFVDTGGGQLTAINASDITMQARWNFADNTNAGKWGTASQIYRHQRAYQPVDATDTFDDGAPVVMTRNKLRGRGRVLHLRFVADTAGKDAHLLGWAIHYKGTAKP